MQDAAEARYVRENVLTTQSQLSFGQPYTVKGSIRWRRHCATSRKVADSIPDGVIGIFHWHIFPAALWLWGRLIL
jgi:hypothetical protein